MSEKSAQYIVAHDLGTSSDKAVLLSVYGDIIAIEKYDYAMHHPQAGFAEQNPLDWWTAVCKTTKNVLKNTGISADQVVGLTFSSLMQCLVPVDKAGNAVCPAITWLDGRAAEIMRQEFWNFPRIQGYNIFKLLKFIRITGGTPGQAGKDQIGRILWLRKYQPEVYRRVFKFIDAKDFIIYHLTGNFVTSVDLAVVWWLLDTRKNKNEWHADLCQLTGITVEQLPEVKNSADIVGTVSVDAAKMIGLNSGTPVINGAGDMSAAAIGSGAINEGEMHVNVGTSGWVGGHYSRRKIDLVHYTGCIGSAIPDKYYLGMAHQETAGLCLEWLKNNVLYHEDQLIAESRVSQIYQVLDKLAAESGPGARGVMFTPWLYGERSPLDDDFVRAGLYNLSLKHNRADLIRAVLEGVAFNTRWAMETLENLYKPVSELNFIGGGASSDIWCQILADITNRNIHQVADAQYAGAKGVALLASIKLGFIDSVTELKKYIGIKQTFAPQSKNHKLYNNLYHEFKNIYKQNKKWYRRMNRGG
jgi:xylulokinase